MVRNSPNSLHHIVDGLLCDISDIHQSTFVKIKILLTSNSLDAEMKWLQSVGIGSQRSKLKHFPMQTRKCYG